MNKPNYLLPIVVIVIACYSFVSGNSKPPVDMTPPPVASKLSSPFAEPDILPPAVIVDKQMGEEILPPVIQPVSCEVRKFDSYADAHKYSTERDKPLYVMLTADWCGPCQSMKRETLEPMLAANEFGDAAFVKVDYDRDPANREQLMKLTGVRSVPQLLAFSNKRGDVVRFETGSVNREVVRRLINKVKQIRSGN